ncbi:MAG: beta-lactamase family protein [Chitinophagales bacterium]|nr:beta-lactamase family protein [Chitinophagales bacterium]
MKKLVFLAAILSLVWSSCSDDVQIVDEATLSLRLEEIYGKSDLPGFSIGIIKNGEITYQEGFGFQNLEENQAFTINTNQPIGSISKTFIGVAIVKAISMGLFTLDTPINDILQAPIVNPKQPEGEITVRHLVTHRSGLVDRDDAYASTYYLSSSVDLNTTGSQLLLDAFGGKVDDTPRSLQELILDYYYPGGALYHEDNFSATAPGAFESYSNLASSLAAYLVEVASGVSYQDFLSTYVFTPLQMEETGFEPSLFNDFEKATLYFDQNTPLPTYQLESFPDGGLRTSISDLSKYVLNMLQGAKGETELLFSRAHYELLFESNGTYSIFWDADVNGNYGHGGGDPGLSTALSFNSDINGGVILLSNYDNVEDSHEEYFNTFLEEEINGVLLEYLMN